MLRLMWMPLVVVAALTVIEACTRIQPTSGQRGPTQAEYALGEPSCQNKKPVGTNPTVNVSSTGFDPLEVCLKKPSSIAFTSRFDKNIQITLCGDGINPDGGNFFVSPSLTKGQSFTHSTNDAMPKGNTYTATTESSCPDAGVIGLTGTIEVASGGTTHPGH